MRKTPMGIIVCLGLLQGLVAGCQPSQEENVGNHFPINTPTISLSESGATPEPSSTATSTSIPVPTDLLTTEATSTNTSLATKVSSAEVFIISEPEGALASMTGNNQSGQTPIIWTVPPGTYTVTLSLDGYENWTAPITIKTGNHITVTATLHKQYMITLIEELTSPLWNLQWSEDGRSLIYALSNEQWPDHVRFLPVYQNWWQYDAASGDIQAVSPPQTRVTDVIRESLAVCPFALPELQSYPCSATLQESPSSNRIAFSSGQNISIEANTWLANIDGSDVIYLDTFPGSPEDVKWSTDGNWLLIGKYYGASVSSNIYYLVSSDGNFVQSLEEVTNINHGLVEGPAPQFSPDGQKIAFVGIEAGDRQLTWDEQNQEEAYNLYVLDLNTMEYQMVSPRFGMFQWNDDGNGLYILDGSASTAGNRGDHIDDLVEGKVNYADFYFIDMTQATFPEQKLAEGIPVNLPYSGAWAYSEEARAMAGSFDLNGSVFSILFLE